MKKMTSIQQETIEQARRHGGRLVRWEGGYWTFEGAEAAKIEQSGPPVPEWFCRTNTIFALVRRGVMEMNESAVCRLNRRYLP